REPEGGLPADTVDASLGGVAVGVDAGRAGLRVDLADTRRRRAGFAALVLRRRPAAGRQHGRGYEQRRQQQISLHLVFPSSFAPAPGGSVCPGAPRGRGGPFTAPT